MQFQPWQEDEPNIGWGSAKSTRKKIKKCNRKKNRGMHPNENVTTVSHAKNMKLHDKDDSKNSSQIILKNDLKNSYSLFQWNFNCCIWK